MKWTRTKKECWESLRYLSSISSSSSYCRDLGQMVRVKYNLMYILKGELRAVEMVFLLACLVVAIADFLKSSVCVVELEFKDFNIVALELLG